MHWLVFVVNLKYFKRIYKVQTEIETTATNQYFMSRSMNNRSRYNICKQDGEDHYITLDTDLEFDYAVAAVELLNNSLEN